MVSVSKGEYRYGFNGKETDNETGLQDYGERIYNCSIAKFLSADPLIVKGKQYPWYSHYHFAGNTPISAIDLDGLEAFYVHGTWSNPSTFSKSTIITVNQITSNTKSIEFKWSGNNTTNARKKAALELVDVVSKNRDPSQPLTLVGHSHGGNVAILTANILKKKGIKVDNIITINTPVRENQLDIGASMKHVNIYHDNDPVQLNGGNLANIPDKAIVIPVQGGLSNTPLVIPTSFEGSKIGTGEIGPAGSSFKSAINIRVPFDKYNIHNTHNTPNKWQESLDKAINHKLNIIPPPKKIFSPQDNTSLIPSVDKRKNED
jgi:RHS repeat-associated protein